MNQTYIAERINEWKKTLNDLMNAPVHDIVKVPKNEVESASVSGVYLISYNISGEILYIGKKASKTIYDRAWQHVNTGATSDLKNMVTLYSDLQNDLTCYGMRWIEITDDRDRYFFEAFAMGVLRPRMNFKK